MTIFYDRRIYFDNNFNDNFSNRLNNKKLIIMKSMGLSGQMSQIMPVQTNICYNLLVKSNISTYPLLTSSRLVKVNTYSSLP